MSDDQTKIETRDNGPLIAKNVANFILPDGSNADAKPVMALCRCGQSANKPFCDGSHNDAGFSSSTESPEKQDRLLDYKGAEVVVHYNPLLCSHAAECAKAAKHIFNSREKPWIQPDNGSLADVSLAVKNCPSNALTMSDPNAADHTFDGQHAITVEKNGPFRVLHIPLDADTYVAKGQSAEKYVLCRCGLSKNKPYCDGTHSDENWSDET